MKSRETASILKREPENLTETGMTLAQRLKAKLEELGIQLFPGAKIDQDRVLEALHILQAENWVNDMDKDGLFSDQESKEASLKYYISRGKGQQVEEIMIVAPRLIPIIAPEGTVVRMKWQETKEGNLGKLFYSIETGRATKKNLRIVHK